MFRIIPILSWLIICQSLLAQIPDTLPPARLKPASSFGIGLSLIPQQTAFFNRQINLSDYDPEPTFGQASGLILHYAFNPRFYLQGELLNSFQGQKYSYSQSERDTSGNLTSVFLYTRSFELNYYKLPVMAGIVLNPGKGVQLQLSLGPQLAYLNTAYYILDADTLIRKDRSFKQTLKKLDTGLVLAAGFQAQVISGLFVHGGIRTDLSLFDAESERFKPIAFATSKNFTGGIRFGLIWHFFRTNPGQG